MCSVTSHSKTLPGLERSCSELRSMQTFCEQRDERFSRDALAIHECMADSSEIAFLTAASDVCSCHGGPSSASCSSLAVGAAWPSRVRSWRVVSIACTTPCVPLVACCRVRHGPLPVACSHELPCTRATIRSLIKEMASDPRTIAQALVLPEVFEKYEN